MYLTILANLTLIEVLRTSKEHKETKPIQDPLPGNEPAPGKLLPVGQPMI